MTDRDRQEMQAGDPRLIVQWARRYAKSRTISFLVQWVFIVAMVVCIGIAASLTNMAYKGGNMVLFTISVVAMSLAILAFTWFSMSRWGGELIWQITQWLYGEEGYVAYLGDRDNGPTPWWLTALGGGLVVYHLAGALLVSFNYLQLKYMQPFSAAYMVPFLAIMIVYQQLGFWAWVWPVLYALHGALLVAGVPIAFTGQWQLLNMVVPVFGYGLAAIVVGHIYSRFALKQLQRVTRSGLPGETETPPPSEDDTP